MLFKHRPVRTLRIAARYVELIEAQDRMWDKLGSSRRWVLKKLRWVRRRARATRKIAFACIWHVFDYAIVHLSGEWLLTNRANGGSVILARALWVTAIVGAIAVGLRERLAAGATWCPAFPHIDTLRDTLPWLGAIFGAAYAALYARFASQWTYLAGLYNQLMATAALMPTPSTPGSRQQEILAKWRAGFIEDAEDLHLATRPMFAAVILSLLGDEAVKDAYACHTAGGRQRLARLEARCRKALDIAGVMR